MKTYVFDIDGTICSTTEGDYENAIPFFERIKRINSLYDDGHDITFYTARGMGRYKNNTAQAYAAFYDLTIKQLNTWGVKYHSLFLGKPSGDIYIDDKGISGENFFDARD